MLRGAWHMGSTAAAHLVMLLFKLQTLRNSGLRRQSLLHCFARRGYCRCVEVVPICMHPFLHWLNKWAWLKVLSLVEVSFNPLGPAGLLVIAFCLQLNVSGTVSVRIYGNHLPV